MFRQLLGRGLPAETRRYLTSSTASLSRDQSVTSLVPVIQCRAVSPTSIASLSTLRCYATATKKATAKNPRTKKPGPPKKTTTAKKTTKPKTKAAAKKKPAKKPAPKRAKKPKKQPTALEVRRTKVNQLRKVALLVAPKQLPASVYQVFRSENQQTGTSAAVQAKAISQAYRNITTSEEERLAAIAKQNAAANVRTKKKWVESHTAWEIKVANNARRHLNRIAKEPVPTGAKTKLVAHTVNMLQDERKVQVAQTPFIAFSRERWGSGDYKDVKAADAARAIGKEWKALTADDKLKYHDVYREAQAKYAEEYERVYGRKHVTRAATKSPRAKKATVTA